MAAYGHQGARGLDAVLAAVVAHGELHPFARVTLSIDTRPELVGDVYALLPLFTFTAANARIHNITSSLVNELLLIGYVALVCDEDAALELLSGGGPPSIEADILIVGCWANMANVHAGRQRKAITAQLKQGGRRGARWLTRHPALILRLL
eukprot:877118-Pyramimonas_sp.AAC.1